MKNKINYCPCGKKLKPGKKYCYGHNRIGCGTNNLGTGWKHKPETIIKLKERKHSKEHNRKVSKALTGRSLSNEHIENLRISHRGLPGQNTPEGNKKISKTVKKNWKTMSVKERKCIGKKISKNLKQQYLEGRKVWNEGLTKETDIRLKKSGEKGSKTKKNPKWIEKYIPKIMKASGKHPNKKEKFNTILIEKARPTDFIYSGDGKIWIVGKNPDWFNVNGKKQVIELFGDYYHGEMFRRKLHNDFKTNKEHELEIKNHYKKYGYDCLVIWEYELKEPDKVIEKIKNF